MKQSQIKSNWLRFTVFFALVLVALGLIGCDSKEAPSDAEEVSAEVEIAAAEVQATETAPVMDAAGVSEVQVEETAVTEEPIDECLACHIDKEMLIATADPEEEVINENEGEG